MEVGRSGCGANQGLRCCYETKERGDPGDEKKSETNDVSTLANADASCFRLAVKVALLHLSLFFLDSAYLLYVGNPKVKEKIADRIDRVDKTDGSTPTSSSQ